MGEALGVALLGTAAFETIVAPGLSIFRGADVDFGSSISFDASGFVAVDAEFAGMIFASLFSSRLTSESIIGFLTTSAFDSVFSPEFGISGTDNGGLMAGVGGCSTGFIRTGAMGGAGGCKTGFIRTGAIGGGSAISSSLSSTIVVFRICDFEGLVSLGVSLVCATAFSSCFCFLRDGSDFSGVLLLLR